MSVEPVFNVVVNDEGTLRELGHLTEQQARGFLDWLENDWPEGHEGVQELAQSLREWLGEGGIEP